MKKTLLAWFCAVVLAACFGAEAASTQGLKEELAASDEQQVAEGQDLQTQEVEKWQCSVSGYVYDPIKGDPDSGIAAGTRFEDIPDDWICPVCKSSKYKFKKISKEGPQQEPQTAQ